MNKTLKYILVFSGVVISLWIIGRVTNMFQWYRVSTISNYPTFKQGEFFFASNLVKPKRFSFITYYSITPEFGKQIWIHRLCGLEGDTIEIRHGDLLVNNQYVDKNLSLAHNYILSFNDFESLKNIEDIDDSYVQNFSPDSVVSYFSDNTITTYSAKTRRQILPKNYKDDIIRKQYSMYWNQDNFGPICVPAGKYFLLGDNRMNAMDSRYIGFVDKSNYIATVIGR